MEAIDFNSLDEEQFKAVEDFVLMIKDRAFTREEFDYRRYQMDLALKQQYLDKGLYDRSYVTYNLGDDQIQQLVGEEAFAESNDYEADSNSDLYLPLLLKFYRALHVNMANLCFPANGDWLNVTRSFSQYFYETGIEGFLPFVNDAWVDIIKTENQRFNTQEKYLSALGEVISYGNTVLGHSYNPDLHYIEPYTPGIGASAIYPISDDWRKSNLILYYDVNYNDLLSRTDLDQEVIQNIEPEAHGSDSQTLASYGSTSMKEHKESNIPFGKVRLYDLFIPSMHYKKGEENYVAKNVFLTCAINPNIKADSELPNDNVFILKARQNVSPVDHGLLFAAYTINLPGVFYQQGPLQPFLPHQYTANQFFSEASRQCNFVTGSPKSITSTNGGIIDPVETPIPDFESDAVYENMKVDLLMNPGEIAQSLSVFLNYMNFFEKHVEEGVGISKAQVGSMHQGRKTATEIKESYSGSQLNVVAAAANYDRSLLRPSIVTRITRTQKILEDQVENAVQGESQMDNPAGVDGDAIYEQVLSTNELFNRLLNYSGIEELYRNFYKKTMNDYLDDQHIFQEVQMMAQQIQAMIAFADSPIPPPPPVPQTEDPEGNVIPTAMEIQQLQQGFIQEQQMQREKARQDAKMLELDMRRKELMFKDTKEPPAPSKKLFYQMFIAPIQDSDVVVTGSMTTVSKELARENLVMMLSNMQAFPESVLQTVDFDGILQLLARANDIPLRSLMKSESQILREQEKAEQQAIMEQQLQMQAAQVPGAQPPQFG